MYSYVQPIIAIVISICVGMDTLSWQKVLAAAMVFGGVVLVNYSRSAKSA
jgi:drug/metabolite transporter (DMT)-like permease